MAERRLKCTELRQYFTEEYRTTVSPKILCVERAGSVYCVFGERGVNGIRGRPSILAAFVAFFSLSIKEFWE
jgi:hypothetical protein